MVVGGRGGREEDDKEGEEEGGKEWQMGGWAHW